jgi:hypothetical protein
LCDWLYDTSHRPSVARRTTHQPCPRQSNIRWRYVCWARLAAASVLAAAHKRSLPQQQIETHQQLDLAMQFLKESPQCRENKARVRVSVYHLPHTPVAMCVYHLTRRLPGRMGGRWRKCHTGRQGKFVICGHGKRKSVTRCRLWWRGSLSCEGSLTTVGVGHGQTPWKGGRGSTRKGGRVVSERMRGSITAPQLSTWVMLSYFWVKF